MKMRNLEAALESMPKTIIIEAGDDVDFTPKGKRRAKIVNHAMSGKKIKPVIRLYVGKSAHMDKDLADYKLVNEWLKG